MKTRKPRYNYIFFLYFPIVVIGFVLAVIWPLYLSASMEWLDYVLLAFVILAAFSPFGQRILPSTTEKPRANYLLLFSLQFVSIIAAYTIYNSFYGIPHLLEGNAANLIQLKPFSMKMLLFPWPLCLLLALALSLLNNSTQTPRLLRFSLQPMFKQSLYTLFGVGIDVFIKQGFLCGCAYVLTLGILQFDLILGRAFSIPIIGGQHLAIFIAGGLLLFLLASKVWTRLLHYFWMNHIAINYLLLILTLLTCSAILLLGLGNRIAATIPLLASTSFSQININSRLQEYSQLTLYCLWILWLPLIAQYIACFFQKQPVRKMLLSGLIVPLGLMLFFLIFKTFNPHVLQQFNSSMYNHQGISLILSVLLVILTVSGFRDPETQGLIQLTALHKSTHTTSSHQMMQQLSNFVIMYTILFLLFGPKILTQLTFSITFPNLITISVASLIALHQLFVEK